jgi:hypothetical protein
MGESKRSRWFQCFRLDFLGVAQLTRQLDARRKQNAERKLADFRK